MDFNKYVESKLVEYGKSHDDYKLLWFIVDDIRTFDYIRALIKEQSGSGALSKADADELIDRVNANERRYKKLAEWIAQEKGGSMKTARYQETYAYIYENEQKTIKSYCLVTLLRLLGIETELDNMVVEERKGAQSLFTVEDDGLRAKREESVRKREATKAAKSVVDKGIRDKDVFLTPEEVEAYDDAFNRKYEEMGGTDEKAKNPAAKAMAGRSAGR